MAGEGASSLQSSLVAERFASSGQSLRACWLSTIRCNCSLLMQVVRRPLVLLILRHLQNLIFLSRPRTLIRLASSGRPRTPTSHTTILNNTLRWPKRTSLTEMNASSQQSLASAALHRGSQVPARTKADGTIPIGAACRSVNKPQKLAL